MYATAPISICACLAVLLGWLSFLPHGACHSSNHTLSPKFTHSLALSLLLSTVCTYYFVKLDCVTIFFNPNHN